MSTHVKYAIDMRPQNFSLEFFEKQKFVLIES